MGYRREIRHYIAFGKRSGQKSHRVHKSKRAYFIVLGAISEKLDLTAVLIIQERIERTIRYTALQPRNPLKYCERDSTLSLIQNAFQIGSDSLYSSVVRKRIKGRALAAAKSCRNR